METSPRPYRLLSALRSLAVPVAGVVLGMSLLAGSATPVQGATLQATPEQHLTVEPGERPVASPALMTIERGETLGKISSRLRVPVEGLLALNPEIRDPDHIVEGATLRVPPAPDAQEAVYIVRRGDAFDRIAARHGLDRSGLLALNPEVHNPHLIVPGQRLRVRENDPRVGPRTVQVRPGDSLSRIALREKRSLAHLEKWNPELFAQPYIHPGDVVRLGPPPPKLSSGPTAFGVGPAEALASEPDVLTVAPTRPSPPAESAVAVVRSAPVEAAPKVVQPQALLTPNLELRPVDAQTSAISPLDGSSAGAMPTLFHSKAAEAPTRITQGALARLGYLLRADIDGAFGTQTLTAVLAFQYERGLAVDGVVGPKTWQALLDPNTPRAVADQTRTYSPGATFRPRSPKLVALFEAAARVEGVPTSWARSDSLHQLVALESNGRIGQPNYTYGARRASLPGMVRIHAELRRGRIRANSSATGLGQLLLSNVERHYPSGRAGIGVPLEEAVGMLSYIKERYGTPERARRLYGVNHEGY